MRARHCVRLVLVATGLLAVAGCGAADEPSRGGTSSKTFVYAVPDVPDSLDAFPFSGDATRWQLVARKSTLIDYDVAKLPDRGCKQVPTNADVTGQLAESWTVSDDGLTITLKLRDTGSQYGHRLSAEDVKWSVERSLALAPFMPPTLSEIGRFDVKHMVTVVDPRTVAFHLTEPFAFAVPLLGNNTMPIFDSTEARKHATGDDPWASKWLSTHIADFGAWKLESFTPGSEIVLTPNPNSTLPHGNVGRLVLRAVPDAAVRMQLLQSGDAQYAARLSYDQYQQLGDSPNAQVTSCVSTNRDFLVLNLADKRLKDLRVRQAISLAIDRDALIEPVYRGFAEPARFGFTQFLQVPQPPADQAIAYDPAKARTLLAQAGYPHGFDLEILYSAVRPGPAVDQLAPVLQAMLGQVGIKVKLRNIAGSADFFAAYNEGNYDAVIYSEGNILSDPTWIGTYFVASYGTNNTFGFKSREWDSTLEQARRAKTQQERD
ncbi:MAG TPA: ABC transporter substrate-binding protein, partial [Solirubrobacter sp.]|nr:ABC transporter substrate-binding protein [Solirubrobacter sp.]